MIEGFAFCITVLGVSYWLVWREGRSKRRGIPNMPKVPPPPPPRWRDSRDN